MFEIAPSGLAVGERDETAGGRTAAAICEAARRYRRGGSGRPAGWVAAERRADYQVKPGGHPSAGARVDGGVGGDRGADEGGADDGAGHAGGLGRGGLDAEVQTGQSPSCLEARERLQRLATTPDSALGAAVSKLAEAVDTLAEVAVADEHVEVVGDAVVVVEHLQRRLHANLLGLLGSFDTREGYRHDGAVSAGSWLARRTNTDHAAAATMAQTARRLEHLPRLAAHLAAGDISPAHVTAVTRAAVPGRAEAIAEAEDVLADLAVTNPPRDVRHALRRLADATDPGGGEPVPDAPGGDPLREVTLRTGFQGRGELHATLDPVTSEALRVLLDAFDTPDGPDTPTGQRRNPSQRRHDAFAAMLHTLLGQPDLPTVQGARPQVLINIDLAALLDLPADHPAAGLSLADLAQRLGIDLGALNRTTARTNDDTGSGAEAATDRDADRTGRNTGDGRDSPETGAPADVLRPTPPPARLGSGAGVSAETVRGLLSAATLTAVLTLGPWRVVNVGAKHRTLPAWLRSVLGAMHRHCRGPDCDRPASWTQAHHILDWALGHTTDLNDTLPLCIAHHDLITNHGWSATLDHTTGEVTWTSPDGRIIVVPPPRR